jgi:hypothetical protein
MPEIQAAADEESSELGILLLLIYTNSKISQDSAKKNPRVLNHMISSCLNFFILHLKIID